MNQRDVSVLVDLGLTGYEASAYVALTRRGRATGAEVARLAGLPRQRIYDVLDGLVARGFASVEPGRPARYTAVAPQEALERLVAGRRASLADLERQAAEAAALLTPIYRDGRSATDPLNYIEVLREPHAIGNRFAELEAGAAREILVFTKPPYAVEPAENVAGLQLLARGVEARSVYERSVYDDDAVVDAVQHFIAAGEHARVVDELPLKLVLIDERVALFTMEDPIAGSTDLTVMIVEHPAFAQLLKLAFEHAWETGEPFSPARRRGRR
ncbi:MAG TPA: helix-turn-helix domain-containing protein [Gaiellaceae bacterium]|nr:helix-turn-helix domain-containing protein [Gaiellaceae bacterium]